MHGLSRTIYNGGGRSVGRDWAWNGLDLSDAPRYTTGPSRRLPDLRHGARTRHGHGRQRAEPRAQGHEPALLGRAGAQPARAVPGDGRTSVPRPASCRAANDLDLDPVRPCDAGRALGGMALFRARLGFAPYAKARKSTRLNSSHYCAYRM